MLLILVHPFRLHDIALVPVRAISDKKCDPDAARQAHKRGLQQDEQDGIDAHPPEKPFIVEGETDGCEPEEEAQCADQDGQRIAYHVGAIVKARLHVKRLAAYRATLMHLHERAQLVRSRISVHPAPPATGTFVLQDTEQETWFFINACSAHMNSFTWIVAAACLYPCRQALSGAKLLKMHSGHRMFHINFAWPFGQRCLLAVKCQQAHKGFLGAAKECAALPMSMHFLILYQAGSKRGKRASLFRTA